MAIYSIRTTRAQEVGLKFSYDTYADKQQYPTQEAYFQFRIDLGVLSPMVADQQRAMSQSFDKSFNTIPETSQPAARIDIETAITSHGGTIVAPGTPGVSPTMPGAGPPPPIPAERRGDQ